MLAYLDTNVLVDVFATRPPWSRDARALWHAILAGRCQGAVGGSAVTDFYYLLRKRVGRLKGRVAVAVCLGRLKIVPVGDVELHAALALPGSDLEDNLQMACAIQAGADAIVTRDPRGFALGPLPVETPTRFLARLPAAG